MASLRTSRATLTHAVLTAIHPSIADNSPFPFPVQLPSELHLMIRTHLRVHIARALLDSLHASLSSALSALCDDCKSYYAHVFGPHVADWPVIQAGRGCRCTSLALPSARSSWKTSNADSVPCSEQDLPQRPPVGDKEPPAYFLAHVQKTLATYASMDPSFPYADEPIASGTDLDALLSRVLSTFGWNAMPSVSHRNWEFDNGVSIVPLDHSESPVSLDNLQLHLDLAIHDEILARSTLHPTKVTYFSPWPRPATTGMSFTLLFPPSFDPYFFTVACYSLNPISTSIVSALVLLAITSPLVVVYALHLSARA